MTRGFDRTGHIDEGDRHRRLAAFFRGTADAPSPGAGIGFAGGGAPQFAPACQAYETQDKRPDERYVFLREIGGASCLPAFLAQAEFWKAASLGSPARGTTVVIDADCPLTSPLRIPPGFTLRGCGIYGAGIITFSGLDATAPAIEVGYPRYPPPFSSFFAPPTTTLQDLNVSNLDAVGTGVSIGRNVQVRNLRITGFSTGISGGKNARDVLIDHVQIVASQTGILARGKNWRIRHAHIRGSTAWAIDVTGDNVMIDGGRFEANGSPAITDLGGRGAIRTRGLGTVILGNYLEQNGYDFATWLGTGVCLHPSARAARIIANFFALDYIVLGSSALASLDLGIPYPYPTLFLTTITERAEPGCDARTSMISHSDLPPHRTVDLEHHGAAAELDYLRQRTEEVHAGSARVVGSGGSCGCAPSRAESPAPDAIGVYGGGQPQFVVPCEAFDLGTHRTNDNFIFLREILQAGEGGADPVLAGACLAQWLKSTVNQGAQPNGQFAGLGGSGVLIIDQLVVLSEAIVIPSQLILSGVGMSGAGRLRFTGYELAPGQGGAITFQVSAQDVPSYASIQDIGIEFADPPAGLDTVGISVDAVGDIVYLRRVSMRNWDRALVNNHGYFNLVEGCRFQGNGVHIDVADLAANAMRVRECMFSGASGPAVRLNSPGVPLGDSTVNANSCSIVGCSFSGNQYGVYVDRHQAATIIGNSFVGNAVAGVYVTSNAREARMIANFFDGGDRLVFEEADVAVVVGDQHHQWGFNTVADEGDGAVLADFERIAVERVYAGAVETLM